MFATFSASAFNGRCTKGTRQSACECRQFAHGGPLSLANTNDAELAQHKASLAYRLAQFARITVAAKMRSAARVISCGVESAIAALGDNTKSVLISNGHVTLALVGDFPAILDDSAETMMVGSAAAREGSAWSLLEHYTTIADMETNKLASSLQQSLGAHRTDGASFVFLLHDRHRHRVIAARNGDSELSWGMAADGSLLFSTTSDSAIDQCESVMSFPEGCVFVSDVPDQFAVFVGGACPGRLLSFVLRPAAAAAAPVPAHQQTMCRIMSGTDLSMITTSKGPMMRTPSMADIIEGAVSRGQMSGAR
jgi:hypothetical protein